MLGNTSAGGVHGRCVNSLTERFGRADRKSQRAPGAIEATHGQSSALFVQREISGMALLAIRMQARMPLRDMVADVLAR
jgi:hypothetical protein